MVFVTTLARPLKPMVEAVIISVYQMWRKNDKNMPTCL